MERKYRQSLNAYDYQPEEMRAYLRYNGWHFNKKMCEWAVKQMRKNGKPIRMMSKDDIEDILKKNNIELENNVGYDAVYIAHMCLADFYGSSITYSNVDIRKTVVAIGWATSKAEYMNSLSHEMLHVVQHISEQFLINMYGEEACYLLGGLVQACCKRKG